jgi:AmiR/NasT family two-component response regulator
MPQTPYGPIRSWSAMRERKIVHLVGTFGAAGPVLIAELARLGYTPGEGPPALTVALVGNAGDEAALLSLSATASPAVAVLSTDDPAVARAAALAGARGLLDLPLRRGAISGQVALAVAAGAHHRRLENKVALLERTLRGRRTIEKATQLLAIESGISQADAYEVLRKTAMNGRVTMAEVANDYVASRTADAEV